MRKLLLLSLGGFVGYVLGARAGRPAYDRLVQAWSGLTRSAGLGDLTTTVKEAAVDVRDTALDRANDAVSGTADDVTRRLDPNGVGRPRSGPTVEGAQGATPTGSGSL